MSKSFIIILSGIPASGKTTFSRYLSKELEIPVISKDSIKEILFDDIGFQSRIEKVKLGVASMNIMYSIAEENMKLNKPVILENNFENSSKLRLKELIQSYGYKVINVRFEGDIKAIYSRFVKRDLSPERHLGHVTNISYPSREPIERVTSMTLIDFKEMITSRGIINFDIGGEIIPVDATELDKVDYKEIVNKVREKIGIV